MPNKLCNACGYDFKLGSIPGCDQWLIISDEAYDQFSGNVDAEEIYRAMQIMLRCPHCGYLWVFWEGFDKPASGYKPD